MIKMSLWAQHWSPKVFFFFSSISALNIYSDIVCFMCVHVFLICWTSYFILKCDVGMFFILFCVIGLICVMRLQGSTWIH